MDYKEKNQMLARYVAAAIVSSIIIAAGLFLKGLFRLLNLC